LLVRLFFDLVVGWFTLSSLTVWVYYTPPAHTPYTDGGDVVDLVVLLARLPPHFRQWCCWWYLVIVDLLR
jgi:hypothetical protein